MPTSSSAASALPPPPPPPPQEAFTLVKIDAANLEGVKTAWEAEIIDLGDKIFPSEHQRVLAWAATKIQADAAAGESVAYVVSEVHSGAPGAIVELVHSSRGRDKWLKMLDITLSPALDFSILSQDLEATKRAVGIFAATVSAVLQMGRDLPATVVKLYGRGQYQMTFLTYFGTELQSLLSKEGIKSLTVTIEGRWLVIKRH